MWHSSILVSKIRSLQPSQGGSFPIAGDWYVIDHDSLVELCGVHTNWLNTPSWLDNGGYSTADRAADFE